MYEKLKEKFQNYFKEESEAIYSAPGRTELSGNHTDHQHGLVLAAAINLEMLAAVKKNQSEIIHIYSEEMGEYQIDVNDFKIHEDEKNTTAALIRGMVAFFKGEGKDTKFKTDICEVEGFDAYITSEVLPGSGLSSSAAFEVLLATIIDDLFNGGKCSAVQIAQIGQWVENNYFGKPSGLMDQTASSVGNIITIDFKDTNNPIVEKVDFNFETCGYTLCIIDSLASHADLTFEYAGITEELKKVANYFGRNYLREVDEELFMAKLKDLRKEVGDRAILRAMHVYAENKRVKLQVEALKQNDFETYLKYVRESGLSSWRFLQNVTALGSKEKQDVAFVLALVEKLLNGKGASRIHGGGFAGTVQVFVKNEELLNFKKAIEEVLGENTCHVLSVRNYGGKKVA